MVVFVGCTTYTHVAPANGVGLSDTIDTDVIGPAQGSSSGAVLFGLISIGGESKSGVVAGSRPQLNPVLKAAIYNAIDSVPGADALIAPRWSIESTNYPLSFIYCKVTATVKGKAVRFNVSE